MTIPAPASCPHELRPGTTRCLHCRSEARAAARARLRRSAGRVALATVVIAIVAVVANAGTTVLRMGDALPGPRVQGALPPAASAPSHDAPTNVATTGTPVRPVTSRQGPPMYAARNTVDRPAPLAGPRGAPPVVQPRVAEGRTELRDSMYVVRSGTGMTVHFDTQDMRTRRSDKFEQIVRTTLPRVYGPLVDSVLTTIPVGQLTAGADLLTELPQRGVFLRVADGGTLAIWPETRPGRDGPLVVSYRATLTH